MTTKILKLPAVQMRTGCSRSSIYSLIAAGKFPPQIKLGRRAVGWVEAEIEAWLAQRIEISRAMDSASRNSM